MKTNNISITEETMCAVYCDCSMYGAQCFEFSMKYGDCELCCHPGVCDNDCEQMRYVDYIRKQLDEITNVQMWGYISEYVCDEKESDRINDREWLELYLIWLVSGDITDEVYMGNAENVVCS